MGTQGFPWKSLNCESCGAGVTRGGNSRIVGGPDWGLCGWNLLKAT